MEDEARATQVIQVSLAMSRGEALFRRWAGTGVDLLFLAVVLFTILMVSVPTTPAGQAVPVIGVLMILLVCPLLLVGYYLIGEAVWGRTLGKLVSGMVVVDRYGRPPGFGKAALRTLLRVVEVNPLLFGAIPAGVAILASAHRQRLGDMAAGTYVVPAKRLREAPADVFS